MNLAIATADPAQAWAPFEPRGDELWDIPRVAHLHRRAGFSAPWSVLVRDTQDGPDASVKRLLDGGPTAGDDQPAADFEALADAIAAQLAPEADLTRLQAIWLYRMIFSPHPLRERMTLFWHNHFATSHAKVKNSRLMQRQNRLFRTHALGDFKALLAAIGKDPAMLIWLDSTENRKAHPNENYAREVMELFTLGRGKYTEKDIQEAARAFTGTFVVRDEFLVVPAQHDPGEKTVLGRTGLFNGESIPPVLLDQPACAEFICTKLARHFLSDVEPFPPSLIAPLARSFRESGYQVRVPVEIILRSNLFHSPTVRRKRVKSPVEFTVGTLRSLEILKPTVQANALAEACGRMGQNLFAPPSVAGWDGGSAWINSTAMLGRANFALALLSKENKTLGDRCDPRELAARHGVATAPNASRFYVDLLLQEGPDRPLRRKVESTKDPKEALTLLLTAPEYQLA